MTNTDRKPLDVMCRSCKHIWTAAYTPMEMGKMAKLLKSIRCPSCAESSKNIFLTKSEEHKND